MRRFFRERLPDHDSILRQRWLRPVQHLLQHHNLWHLHRRSVAGGVAVGLLCGLIPGPLQMIAAALLAVSVSRQSARGSLHHALYQSVHHRAFISVGVSDRHMGERFSERNCRACLSGIALAAMGFPSCGRG